MFGLLGLYVIMKGIISSLLVVFGCLKTSRGIYLALNLLASINNIGYFCSGGAFFCYLKRFFFYISILNNNAYSPCKREQLNNVIGCLT